MQGYLQDSRDSETLRKGNFISNSNQSMSFPSVVGLGQKDAWHFLCDPGDIANLSYVFI